jgi:hypothetical protein
LTSTPLRRLAGHHSNQGPQISFDRPELSPSLTRVSEQDRREALALILAGAAQLAVQPEADMPGFVPCAIDQWRDQKYLARQQVEQRNREAIRAGKKLLESAEE